MTNNSRSSRKALYGQIAFLVFFAIFWSTGVVFFDVFLFRSMARQMAAESFPVVSGTITRSEIRETRDSDGVSYRPEVVFQYEVDDRMYEADTWRFDAIGMSDPTDPQRVVNQYPAGTEVDVFYNPDDPGEAVLEPGVSGTEHFLAIFLAPFNFIGLFIWGLLIQMVRLAVANPPAGGVPIRKRGELTVLRLPRIPPLVAGLFGAVGVCFISVFIGGFGFHFAPPMWFVSAVWILSVLVCGAIFLWRSFVVGSGAKDLVIDPVTRVLDLPQSYGRKEPSFVPFDAIREWSIVEETSSTSKGGQSTTYCPTVRWTTGHGEERSEKVSEFNLRFRAESFVDRLRAEIGAPVMRESGQSGESA